MKTIADIFYSKYKHVKNLNIDDLKGLIEKENLKIKWLDDMFELVWNDAGDGRMYDFTFEDRSSLILDFKGSLLLPKHFIVFEKWFKWWTPSPNSSEKMVKKWKINREIVRKFYNNDDTFEQFLKKQKRLIRSYIQSKRARQLEALKAVRG